MKIIRFSIAFLLLAGCQGGTLEEFPNLDDPQVLEKIVAQAVDMEKLEAKRVKGYLILCVPETENPFSGWVKAQDDNGSLHELGKLNEGRKEGIWTTWNKNGKKQRQIEYHRDVMDGTYLEWHSNGKLKARGQTKDGEMDGRWIGWYENGNRAKIQVCRRGLLVSAHSWKPDGSRCTETNATAGSGIFVQYNGDGSILKRSLFSNGIGKQTK